MLQRLVEDLEYTSVLDEASTCEDEFEQMALVAAFSTCGWASLMNRTSKPFNPLLGETYELDRTGEQQGWRAVCEQVITLLALLTRACTPLFTLLALLTSGQCPRHALY